MSVADSWAEMNERRMAALNDDAAIHGGSEDTATDTERMLREKLSLTTEMVQLWKRQAGHYRTALEAIPAVDATPRYEYGEARPDGTEPGLGRRWNTPREIAQDTLLRLAGPQREARPASEGADQIVSSATTEPDARCPSCGQTIPSDVAAVLKAVRDA